jgi:predicted transcriptional regulator YheO
MKHQERLARIQIQNVNQPVVQHVNQTSQTVQETVKNHAFDTVNLSRTERKKQLLESMVNIYIHDSNAKVSTVANTLKVSRQTVYNYLNELEQAGRINRNGNGVEAAK